MSDEPKLGPLARCQIWHGGKCYLVSTINRESSAEYGGVFAETLVWEWDSANNKRARDTILLQDEGPANSISTHLAICEKIFSEGIKE